MWRPAPARHRLWPLLCLAGARGAASTADAAGAPAGFRQNAGQRTVNEDGPTSQASLDTFDARILKSDPGVQMEILGSHRFNVEPGMPLGTPQQILGSKTRKRPFTLYIPRQFKGDTKIPLWILAPGDLMTMDGMLNRSKVGMIKLAERYLVAMVVLKGVWTKFAVEKDAQGKGYPYPDDVAYTKSVLRAVTLKISVDMDRIRCVGFSRGARFCARLASELSGFISGIAVLSGVRFPRPNNATRPIPVLAFHGTSDPINPFYGGGRPYWGESVFHSMLSWAKFNGCRKRVKRSLGEHVVSISHSECDHGSDVMLYELKGGGHTWPLPRFLDANEEIYKFFKAHSTKVGCHTSTRGEHCYGHVKWVMHEGLKTQPALYPRVNESSSFEEVQSELRRLIYADCREPCPAGEEAAAASAELDPEQPAEDWELHEGLNCVNGQGGYALPDMDKAGSKMDLQACQLACEEKPDCEGVLMMPEHDPGDCWLRTNLKPSECIQGTPWDLWIQKRKVADYVSKAQRAPGTAARPPWWSRFRGGWTTSAGALGVLAILGVAVLRGQHASWRSWASRRLTLGAKPHSALVRSQLPGCIEPGSSCYVEDEADAQEFARGGPLCRAPPLPGDNA